MLVSSHKIAAEDWSPSSIVSLNGGCNFTVRGSIIRFKKKLVWFGLVWFIIGGGVF